MGIDTMIILVLIPFLLVLLAQIILKITYRKYESIETDTGLTGKKGIKTSIIIVSIPI